MADVLDRESCGLFTECTVAAVSVAQLNWKREFPGRLGGDEDVRGRPSHLSAVASKKGGRSDGGNFPSRPKRAFMP